MSDRNIINLFKNKLFFLNRILESLTKSLISLGENADKQPTTYPIIRDQRVNVLK
jgi:hypothetical protein